MQFQDALGDWSARPGPLYIRLAAAIRDAIACGDIPAGGPLPPERSLARRLAIGRTTVTGAYAQLREEELVESRQGSGTWVRGGARAASGEPQRESLPGAALRDTATLIDLATAALPAPRALRGLLAKLAEPAAGVLDAPGYLPAGLPDLRRALAAQLTADGLATSVDEILVTTGSQQALSLLCADVLSPGDAAVVEDPTGPGILDILHGLPVAVRSARPAASGADDLVRVIDNIQARMAYVMPTLGPHGRVLGHADRTRLARALAERTVLVVEDVSQAALAFELPPPPLAACAQSPNLISVGSLTKLHWGGLRIGWIRGPASLVARLTRAKVRADLGSPVLEQVLAVSLLASEDEVRAERLELLRDSLRHAQTVLPRHLPEFTWRPPDGGLNLWLRLPAGTGSAFAEVAARFGVAIVPGALLSEQAASDDHIRLAYVRSPGVFEEGIRRLAAAWDHYRRSAAADPSGPTAPVLI
jgi:DNA-binding transcriptional MocR family regulator